MGSGPGIGKGAGVCMSCQKRYLVGEVNGKDEVSRMDRRKVVHIVNTINKEYGQDSCTTAAVLWITDQKWFKSVSQFILNENKKRFKGQVFPEVWLCKTCQMLIMREVDICETNSSICQLVGVSRTNIDMDDYTILTKLKKEVQG